MSISFLSLCKSITYINSYAKSLIFTWLHKACNTIYMQTKICAKCKKEKSLLLFGWRKNRNNYNSYCRDCEVNTVNKQRKAMKQRCIEYKGGKCFICGYDKCARALDFHHVNPKEKEFSLGWIRTNGWDTVKKELNKCVLLCSRCHMEIHDGITVLPSQ